MYASKATQGNEKKPCQSGFVACRIGTAVKDMPHHQPMLMSQNP
jgi:hypothetical protein